MQRYCYFFHLLHTYVTETDALGDEIRETKELGVYSSLRKAKEAMERFRPLSGFCLYPDGFILQKIRCSLTLCPSKGVVTTVYMPYHERYLPESDCDYVTRGGLHDTAESAQRELLSWQRDPGFVWCEEGTNILEYTVDEDSRFWCEGFTKGDKDIP